MKAIIIFLSIGIMSANAFSKSMKVAVKPFSSVIQLDKELILTNVEVGLGIATCSWGWCDVKPNSFEKLIPVDVEPSAEANLFLVTTLKGVKLKKSKSFTEMSNCRVGLRVSFIDQFGNPHDVERTVFSHRDAKECGQSKVLTPLLQERLDENIIRVRMVQGRALIET